MSTHTLALASEFDEIVGWGMDPRNFFGKATTPTDVGLLNWLHEGEMAALEALPERSYASGTFSAVAGTRTYTDITDIWDRQILAVRLQRNTDDLQVLDYLDHTELTRERPEWDVTTTRGEPDTYTINPATGAIMLDPLPSAARTIHVTYIATPTMFGWPADSDWFLRRFPVPGTTAGDRLFSGDFSGLRRSSIDRSRNLNILGSVTGDDVTFEFYKNTGVFVTETVNNDSGSTPTNSLNPATELVSIKIESSTSGGTMSVGLSSTFATTDKTGATVAYQTTSHMPDSHALKIGPVWAAHKWYSAENDGASADHYLELFNRNVEAYTRKIEGVPDKSLYAFGRSRGGMRRPASLHGGAL